MHVAVIGASGATGRQIVELSLARKWSVTAIVRNPDSVKDIVDENFKVKVADVYSSASLQAAFEGCDAVLSCLGPRGLGSYLPWATVDIYSQPLRCIVQAIRDTRGLNRLIFLTSAGIKPSPDYSFVFEWMVKPLIRAAVADMVRAEDHLASEECQDINFVVVKPKHLTNGPITDTELIAEEKEYAVGKESISRADVARFMLDCITSDVWSKKFVAITLP